MTHLQFYISFKYYFNKMTTSIIPSVNSAFSVWRKTSDKTGKMHSNYIKKHFRPKILFYKLKYKKVNSSRFQHINYDDSHNITLSTNQVIRMIIFKENDVYTSCISSIDFFSAILVVNKEKKTNCVRSNNGRNVDILNDTDVYRCKLPNEDKRSGQTTTVLTVNGIYSWLFRKSKTNKTKINYSMLEEIEQKVLSIMIDIDRLKTSNLLEIKTYMFLSQL